MEPKDGFVIKARPAQLNCSVIYSEKVTNKQTKEKKKIKKVTNKQIQ